jgi:hypothetical protein
MELESMETQDVGLEDFFSDLDIEEINKIAAGEDDTETTEVEETPEEETEGETEGSTEGKTAEEGETTPEVPKVFELKHLDKTYQKTEEEMIPLAQKGMDYDRIRTKHDAMAEELKEIKDWVKDITGGQDFKTFREEAEARRLAEKENLDYDTALEKVRIRSEKAEIERERQRLEALKAEEKAAQEQAEKQQRDIDAFIKAYPDVASKLNTDPNAIPQEVWELVRSGESLVSAYAVFEARSLAKEKETELEQIKKELENLKLNTKNKERSTGSLSTDGSGDEYDPIRAGWESV